MIVTPAGLAQAGCVTGYRAFFEINTIELRTRHFTFTLYTLLSQIRKHLAVTMPDGY